MGSAVSRRNRPPPACRTHIRTLQGEARLTAHRHRQSFAVGDPASSPPAPPHGKHRFAPCPRTRPAGHAYARSRGKHGSLPTDTGSPFAVSDPANTPPAPPHGSVFLACACPRPPTYQAEPPHTAAQFPAQQKQDTPEGVSCFSMGSERVMPWQNGSDRNISRYSGGTVRCNVPPDRNAAA